jgi:hypothetical protein
VLGAQSKAMASVQIACRLSIEPMMLRLAEASGLQEFTVITAKSRRIKDPIHEEDQGSWNQFH